MLHGELTIVLLVGTKSFCGVESWEYNKKKWLKVHSHLQVATFSFT
jgi:hypothetical protein